MEYGWHHRDGGVREGADDYSGEDDIRNGVANGGEGGAEVSDTLSKEGADVRTLMDRDV